MKNCIFLVFLALARRSDGDSALQQDMLRWRELLGLDPHLSKARLLARLFGWPEFRNLFYYRTKQAPFFWRLLRKIAMVVFPPLADLHIATKSIGPGLFLQHGFATIIAARRIGKNCWINQQVTIGYSAPDHSPDIGDDVTIGAGAILVGKLTVGDKAVIGAGTTVTKSVPAHSTVVSARPRLIKRHGVSVEETL